MSGQCSRNVRRTACNAMKHLMTYVGNGFAPLWRGRDGRLAMPRPILAAILVMALSGVAAPVLIALLGPALLR